MSETPDRWARRDEQSVPLSLQEVEEIDSPWGRPLTCPICGFYYVHFGEPRLEPSDDYGAWNGRGQAVVVPMTCEYGDSWEMVLGFHKGNSYLVTRSHVAGSEESD